MKVKESIKAYHAKPGLTKTKLFRLIEKNPEYYKYCEEHPELNAETPAQLFGAAFHKYVLEPEEFSAEYAVMPNVDRRTKAGREEYAAFAARAGERGIITDSDYFEICRMSEKLKSIPVVKYLLTGEVETSYYFRDELTGLELQARPDVFRMVGDHGVVVDLKTCRDASNDEFRKAAINLGYDVQAAIFLDAMKAEYGIECDFIFVAIEKDPPYMVNVLSADEYLVKYGRERLREALSIYKECETTGIWWGYNGEKMLINNLILPNYLAKEIQ